MNANETRPWQTLFFTNRHLLILSIIVILAAGAAALTSLPRLEDPRITNRNPLIITALPGASAERVESQVTEKLEERLKEVPEIKDLESTSRSGVSVVRIELQDDVTTETNQEIFSKIRDKINDARSNLPTAASDPLFDDQRDPAAFTVIVGLTWTAASEPAMGILTRKAEDLGDRLRNVTGTELVRIYGNTTEELTVTVDRDELAALGLNAAAVAAAVKGADSKQPAGAIRDDERYLLFEVAGEIDSVQRVRDIPLHTGRGDVVKLGDIAKVEKAWRSPPQVIGLDNGNRSVFVGARMELGQRVDLWNERAQSTIAAFREEVGHGVAVNLVFEQAKYTNARLMSLGNNLLAGALVVVAVILFTMGWRLAIIVGAALPLTAALTLFAIQLRGGTLQQMSMFGMVIALGLLIDNAIVVTDEVNHRLKQGRSRREAVAGAIRHLAVPLFASTLTTMLAFAPIMLLPGNAGDFVGSIGTSVVIALFFSFLLAMTITPALAGLFGRPSTDRRTRWWRDGMSSEAGTRRYRGLLLAALRYPIAAIAVAILPPLLGFIMARNMGNEFFPPVDRNMFEVKVWLPNEASAAETQRQAVAIESRLRELDDDLQVHWMVGNSFPSVFYNLVMTNDLSPFFAHGIVTTRSPAETARLIPKLQTTLNQEFPAIQAVVRQFGQGPPVFADIEYRIYGPSIPQLQDLGESLRAAMQIHPSVLHTQATMARGEPRLVVRADEEEARLTGLDLGAIASQLQVNLEGVTGGSFLDDLEELPVRIRFSDQVRSDLDQAASMSFVSPGLGEWVPMPVLGDVRLEPRTSGITRFNSRRCNIIKGYITGDALAIDVTYDILDALETNGFNLPNGYRLELGGTAEQENEAVGNLATYAPLLVLMMISTLILSFRSVRIALTLGMVAGLSAGLGLMATHFMGLPFSFNTILGTFGLIGVALNDSIVVVAAIRANKAARHLDLHAIVTEVVGCTRHLVSTTLTTIGGFLPLLIFVGGDFWPSLAIVLVGGVAGSTILAMIFIPATYVLFHRHQYPPTTHAPATEGAST